MTFALYDSLTADQKSRAHAGIKAADLTPAQCVLALEAARETLIDNHILFIRLLVSHLLTLQDKRTIFTWMRMRLSNVEAFGYQGPFGPNEATWHFPLNNGYTSEVGGAHKRTVVRSAPAPASETPQPLASPIIREQPSSLSIFSSTLPNDPTQPTDLDRFLAPGMLSGRLASTMTLGEFAHNFNDPKLPGLNITVDDAIADKPVTLYGSVYSDSNRLIRGIASIYGLQIVTSDDLHYKIVMPRPRKTDRPEDASAEIFRLLPPSIMRYYYAQTSQVERVLPQKTAPSDQTERVRQMTQESYANATHNQAASQAQKSLYFPAIRRLLVIAEPAVPTANSSPVSVASLEPEASRLISLAMLAGPAMYEISHLSGFKLPQCLQDPDSLCVRMDVFSHRTQQELATRFGYSGSGGFKSEGITAAEREDP
jgi:hypothetical protein